MVFCMAPLHTTRACQSKRQLTQPHWHTSLVVCLMVTRNAKLARQLGCMAESCTPNNHVTTSAATTQKPTSCCTRRCRLGIWQSHDCSGLQAIPNTAAHIPVEKPRAYILRHKSHWEQAWSWASPSSDDGVSSSMLGSAPGACAGGGARTPSRRATTMKASKRLDIRKCCCFLCASVDIKRQAATSHKTGNNMRQDTLPKPSAHC
jgi:hypothetical protein